MLCSVAQIDSPLRNGDTLARIGKMADVFKDYSTLQLMASGRWNNTGFTGLDGLFLCTMMAGAMLCLMGLARMGSVIRFIPYPVSRAFTKGIAILILASQIKSFFGL